MRASIRIPAVLALSLILTVPALAQSTHKATPAPADATKTATAAKADPDKAYLLREEYVAKTAELRGKITARQAELETLLATKPDDTAGIKKLTAEISTLRGQLLEQTTLFRVRFAKETGTPMRMTRGLGHMDGMGGMMDEGSKDCKMMGKGGMMMGQGMKGMDHGAMGKDMPMMDKGAMNHEGMDHGAMAKDMPMNHNQPAPAAAPTPAAGDKS